MRIIVLFTRDLRVRDHPALAAACAPGNQVLPLFVADPTLWSRSPNRAAFLRDSLLDLDRSLARRGAPLVIRRGDVAETTLREVARRRVDAVYLTSDVTATARRRLDAIRDGAEVVTFDGNEVVAPGRVAPADAGAYRVFTPYLRAWERAERRRLAAALRAIAPVPDVPAGRMPARPRVATRLPAGGETAGRARLRRFLRRGTERYADARNDLAADATSRLSPYLRFGCVSPLEVERLAAEHDGADAFRRELAWRDFFRQLVAADPTLTSRDLRPQRAVAGVDDADAAEAWRSGRTGEPLVDTAMRQLADEGWLPNRARLIVASHLTRTLGVDWRVGAAHFDRLLVDGDPSSNAGNWQWVAGTGANPRRGVALNMQRQAARFDPDGSYREAHGRRR
jgi:deoxyribodipyrimidine photo-lyase